MLRMTSTEGLLGPLGLECEFIRLSQDYSKKRETKAKGEAKRNQK